MCASTSSLATASMALAITAGKDMSRKNVKKKNVIKEYVIKDIPKNADFIVITRGASLASIDSMSTLSEQIQFFRSLMP
jgi:hypothetical protein